MYCVIFGGNYHKWFLFLERTKAVDAETTEELTNCLGFY